MNNDVILTLGAFILLTTLTHVATKVFTRNKPLEDKRFWQLTFRNGAMFLGIIVLFTIWRHELQSVMVALGAAAAGIFVAFREAWLSLLAFWIRMVKRHYVIGDYIEIDGIKGRVVDITWQHTVLAESSLGHSTVPFTGRQLQVPNNRMLLANLAVENMTGKFTPHHMTFPMPCGGDVLGAEAILLRLAYTHCAPYHEEALAHMKAYQNTSYMEAPSVAPRVTLLLNDNGNVTLHLRIVVPSKFKMRIEQAILRDFFRDVPLSVWPKNGRCK